MYVVYLNLFKQFLIHDEKEGCVSVCATIVLKRVGNATKWYCNQNTHVRKPYDDIISALKGGGNEWNVLLLIRDSPTHSHKNSMPHNEKYPDTDNQAPHY